MRIKDLKVGGHYAAGRPTRNSLPRGVKVEVLEVGLTPAVAGDWGRSYRAAHASGVLVRAVNLEDDQRLQNLAEYPDRGKGPNGREAILQSRYIVAPWDEHAARVRASDSRREEKAASAAARQARLEKVREALYRAEGVPAHSISLTNAGIRLSVEAAEAIARAAGVGQSA